MFYWINWNSKVCTIYLFPGGKNAFILSLKIKIVIKCLLIMQISDLFKKKGKNKLFKKISYKLHFLFTFYILLFTV